MSYGESILSQDTQRHLIEVLYEKKPKIVVEIGSWLGASARLILNSLHVEKLYCIDTWLGSVEHLGKTELLYERFLENSADLMGRLEPIRMDSVNGVIALQKRDVVPDLVFLDGNHARWQVMADLMTIFESFPQCPILCDDTGHPDVEAGLLMAFSKHTVKTDWRIWSCLIEPR